MEKTNLSSYKSLPDLQVSAMLETGETMPVSCPRQYKLYKHVTKHQGNLFTDKHLRKFRTKSVPNLLDIDQNWLLLQKPNYQLPYHQDNINFPINNPPKYRQYRKKDNRNTYSNIGKRLEKRQFLGDICPTRNFSHSLTSIPAQIERYVNPDLDINMISYNVVFNWI